MNENRMSEIIESSINSLKSIAGADTIIGEAIKTDDGVTIIPVSKLSIGFVSGGIDGTEKNDKGKFGGAGGTGLTLTPVCFIVIHADGKVEMLNINEKAKNFPDPVGDIVNLVEKSPEIISKLKEVFGKKEN